MHTFDSHGHPHADAPPTTSHTIRWASHYDLVVRLLSFGNDRAFRRKTVELAHLQPGEAVLEVGCGTGDVAFAAKACVGPTGQVFGIDAAPEMIGVAQSKATRTGAEVVFRVEPIESLSFAEDTFDVVLSSLMMHHLPDDLKPRGLAEIRRVLKPGGRLVIVDFKRATGFSGHILSLIQLHNGIRTGVQDLPALLQANGFVEIQSGDVGWGVLGYVVSRNAQ
ncbi:MAG: class I SAM-dependent methyltransferase [Anaerolineales bacterium]